MTSSPTRIAIALLSASVLIAGALLVRALPEQTTRNGTNSTATVTVSPERSPIKTLDENNDGVPDWQEALLVTEALDIASTTSTYKEPETLTEQFAIDFFQNMVRSENYGAFGDSSEELVQDASEALADKATDKLYALNDIILSGDTSIESLVQYGETIADITTRYPVESIENEALILERALRAQDASILTALDNKIEVYAFILRDTLSTSVPTTLTQEHLNLINSYQAVLNDIKAMRNAFIDPMLTLLRMKRYQDDATGLGASLSEIYTKLQLNGATWDENSPVFMYIQSN